MKMIELNKEIPQVRKDDLDQMISELIEREEFACTGHISCAGNACGIKDC